MSTHNKTERNQESRNQNQKQHNANANGSAAHKNEHGKTTAQQETVKSQKDTK